MRRALIVLALAALAACASLQKEGAALIAEGRYMEGLAKLELAMRQNPGDPDPKLQYVRGREIVINTLVQQAGAQLESGNADAARSLYRQVLDLDPVNSRATAGLAAIDFARRHQVLAGDAKARLAKGDTVSAELMVKAILAENPNHREARALEQELREQEKKQAIAATPALQSRLRAPVTLTFRDAPLRLVMEALSRSADVNFILDREVRPDIRATIFVKNVRVEDAIDLILQNNQLEKKVLSDNTILIYPSTPAKLREHQELVMRTFHIGNADPKQTLNLLRTMIKTKDVFVDERANLIVMRDTPDAIRAAERLIAAQDVADPEVVLELEILEVSRSKVRDLGITTPTEFAGPSGTLHDIANITSRTVTVDTGFKLKLLRTDSDTKTLANPRVRVRNKERARVHIGDRVPVISSTIVGTAAGGAAPVTTEQIQYLDVGIKIDAEPQIYPDNTIAVKINLDVSSLGTQTKTNAGTTAYEVGTRNATTVLRLKDGETQALMGLIRDDDVQTGTGLPFIGEIPILDRIFGTKKTDQRRRELVLLITPQLVRGVQPTDAALAEFWSGTEAALRMRSPYVQPVADTGKPGAAAPATNLALAPVTPTAPPVPLAVSWRAPKDVKPGQDFVIELRGRSEGALKGASVQLRYDPAELEVLTVEDGGYFKQPNDPTVFTHRVDPALGIVFATLGVSGAGTAKGDAPLITVRAKAKEKVKSTRLQVSSVVGVDPSNRRVPIEGSTPLDVLVQP